MNKIIAASTLTLLLAACGQDNTPTQTQIAEVADTHVEKHSGLLLENMNTEVRPGDDFNAYVNGSWIDTNEIPADRASNSVGLIVHEEATANVKTIIEEAADGDFAKGTDEQKVGALYASYMDMETRNKLGVTPLEPEFSRINTLENHGQLAAYFAEANKLGIDLPFALAQYVDFKDPNTYMMYTWQAGLGLPDREYYFEEGERSEEIRRAYVSHMETMFAKAGLANGEDAAKMIMALETRMAAEHMKKEKTRDMVALYNKIPLDELPELMPDFAWDEYLASAAISGIDGLVVTQLDHMRALNDIIKDTSMDDWKTYLTWKVLDANAGLLNAELDQQNFEFYSKTLRGIEEPLPRWKRAVGNVNNNLGEVVGKVYVARHFPPEAKEQMLELVNNLIKAYEISIKELDWMGDETKVQALDKLSKFTPKIGYPDNWEDYSRLEIVEDDLVGNMQRSALFVYEKNLARQGGPVDKSEWAMTPQTVNAYYNPPLNEIVFPAAILQPPFFDFKADAPINYGGIGAVIGHEISHGFDDNGSRFDSHGNMVNWWSEEDLKNFKDRGEKLVAQFDAYEALDSLFVNGQLTLGENIGDLGGVNLAWDALQKYFDTYGKTETIDGYTPEQRFFMSWGTIWRTKFRDEALRTQVMTNPHSPGMYRANGPLMNIDAFYEAFDVKEGDGMFKPKEDRIVIW